MDGQVKPDHSRAGPLDDQDLSGEVLGLNQLVNFFLLERGTCKGTALQAMLEVRITATQGAIRA